MEPDDFRACLISMGYDLVSIPNPCPRGPHQCPVLHMDHLLCVPTLTVRDLLITPIGAGRNYPISNRGY